MSVSGATSTPSWSTANSAVATVDSSGLVSMVGKGTTTLICKSSQRAHLYGSMQRLIPNFDPYNTRAGA